MIKRRQLITGRERRESRAAVLRRSEQTCFSSTSDDEVGGFQARCANAQSKGRERRESRAAVLRRSEQTCFSSTSDDEVGGFQARCANAQSKGDGGQR